MSEENYGVPTEIRRVMRSRVHKAVATFDEVRLKQVAELKLDSAERLEAFTRTAEHATLCELALHQLTDTLLGSVYLPEHKFTKATKDVVQKVTEPLKNRSRLINDTNAKRTSYCWGAYDRALAEIACITDSKELKEALKAWIDRPLAKEAIAEFPLGGRLTPIAEFPLAYHT
jgi:hypothetical protein